MEAELATRARPGVLHLRSARRAVARERRVVGRVLELERLGEDLRRLLRVEPTHVEHVLQLLMLALLAERDRLGREHDSGLRERVPDLRELLFVEQLRHVEPRLLLPHPSARATPPRAAPRAPAASRRGSPRRSRLRRSAGTTPCPRRARTPGTARSRSRLSPAGASGSLRCSRACRRDRIARRGTALRPAAMPSRATLPSSSRSSPRTARSTARATPRAVRARAPPRGRASSGAPRSPPAPLAAPTRRRDRADRATARRCTEVRPPSRRAVRSRRRSC